jgi:carboxyl-terminal processing protease
MRVNKWVVKAIAGCGLLMMAGISDHDFQVVKSMELFGQVYMEVNKSYVDETNPTQLMRTGIDAMLGSLDPYTNFYGESLIEASKVRSTGQLAGVGVELDYQEGFCRVIEIEKDGPAASGGLKVGDRLTQIDNIPIETLGEDIETLYNLLSGQKGSAVELHIIRNGEPTVVSLVRQPTKTDQQNVRFTGMINDSVGYVKLIGFNPNAGADVEKAVAQLKTRTPSMKSIVLDLRGNPGGILGEAVNICNVFVPKGIKIVEMKGRSADANRSYATILPHNDTSIRLAILIDGMSASASEIVSGALQDLDRGVVIGRKSYGKGLVQNVRPLGAYGTQMKITIAKYYTPSGRCIQSIQYNQGSTSQNKATGVFYTKNGRKVYDGGGVDPDLKVESPELKPVTDALLKQGLMFEFANEYAATHPAPADPRSFFVDDAVYQSFVQYVQQQGFQFSTRTEQEIANLEKEAVSRNMPELARKAQALRQDLNRRKAEDLKNNRAEISWRLRREIVRRYFFQDGVLQASFDDDPDIMAAVNILGDPKAYRSILGK